MLVELNVDNVAIIQKAQLALGPGFSVLTGETGAGKSLFIDAVQLVLGARAGNEIVRTGAESAIVDAVFDLSGHPLLLKRVEEMGFATEDGRLFIQRQVGATGKSQARVGGKSCPVASLKQLGVMLVDLHGQHDTLALLDADNHLGFIDEALGDGIEAQLVTVKDLFEKWSFAKQELSNLQKQVRDRAQRIDLISFQLKEIQEVDPKVGELDSLMSELTRLQNWERLQSGVEEALKHLNEEDGSVLDRLATSLAGLTDVQKLVPSLAEPLHALVEAQVSLKHAVFLLGGYGSNLDGDPERLEEIAARVDQLKRILKKYAVDEEGLIGYAQELSEEFDQLGDFDYRLEQAEQKVNMLQATLETEFESLSQLRRALAPGLTESLRQHLVDMLIPNARLEVQWSKVEATERGFDHAEILFSANPGEELRPLRKIASGGELSRLMLAIKAVLADKGLIPTLIFDEVDTGLSGRAAAAIGRKLRELATRYQVLAITHLPQIAAKGSTHYRIEKQTLGDRVWTTIRELEMTERKEEVARLLAGEEVTDAAIHNAEQLLDAS